MGSSSAIRAVGAPARAAARRTGRSPRRRPPGGGRRTRRSACPPAPSSANRPSHPASSRSSSWKWIAAVLLGSTAPVDLRAVPAMPGRRAHRALDGLAVPRPDGVGDAGGADVAGEVPRRHDLPAGEHARRLELAVEPGAEHEISARDARPRSKHPRRPHLLPAGERIVRRHRERRRPLGHEVRDEPVPDADAQDGVREELGAAHAQRRDAVAQQERGAVAERDHLRLGHVQRGKHPRLQRASRGQLQPGRVGDAHARARAGSPAPRRDGGSPPSPPAP